MRVAPCAGLLLLIGHTIQQGVLPGLLLPQNVSLASENCRSFLMWHPAPDSTNSTQYEVERIDDNRSDWIKETSCRRNHLRQTQRCELHLSSLYTRYQARVRAQDGARLSRWAYSNELQLYKDTVIGPLNLSLAAADGNLTVVVSMPHGALGKMCPYPSILTVQINLTEEGGNSQPIKDVARRNLTKYTFEDLKPNVNYCVHVEVLKQPAKKVIRCITMPNGPAGDYPALLVLASAIAIGVTLLGVVGVLFFRHYLQPRPSEIDFPKSLRFRNREPNESCPACRPILFLEESSIASLSTVMPPPNDSATAQQETLPIPLIASGYWAGVLSDYCANGFDRGNSSSLEETSSLSVAGVEPLSSRESVWDEDLVDGSSQTTLGLLGSSASPCPSSPGRRLYSRSDSSWFLKPKAGSNGKEARLPSSFDAAISLSSLKLQGVLDIHSPMCSPRAYVAMKDDGAQPEDPAQKAAESQVCPSQPGFPEDSALHRDSNWETKGTETMTLSGYEPHQPILSCE